MPKGENTNECVWTVETTVSECSFYFVIIIAIKVKKVINWHTSYLRHFNLSAV